MNKKLPHFFMLFVCTCLFFIISKSYACESGHWLTNVFADGEIIVLEDGSKWQVDAADKINTSLWLPTENIIICPEEGYLINVDDNEQASVTQLQ
jgi:hypothetical protein